jgi:hypothetical protein
MKEGVWYGGYSTTHHTVWSQNAHFSGIFQNQKIVVKLAGPRFSRAANFT